MGLSSASKLLWIFFALIFLMPGPGSTPEATLTDFISAWNAGNVAKAATMVVGGKPNADFSNIVKALPKGMRFTLGTMKSSVDGDKAQVEVLITYEVPDRRPEERNETVNLALVDKDWLIVPAGKENLGQGMITSLATITTDAEVFALARNAAKKTACLSNVKQLALAVMMYLADNDDNFRLNPSKLKATLKPYTKSDALWFCPSGSKTIPAYSINANLAGKSLAKLRDPVNTVMMYEGSKGRLDFRHEGAACVAYADGHAKIIKVADAEKLNWKP